MAGREAAIRSLLESFDASVGKEVKERVRLKSDGTPRTLNSFNSELSVIRCEVYKRFEPTIDDSLREIAQSADARLARDINAFLVATLRDKVRIQCAHAKAPSWPAEVESALSRCRLLRLYFSTQETSTRGAHARRVRNVCAVPRGCAVL